MGDGRNLQAHYRNGSHRHFSTKNGVVVYGGFGGTEAARGQRNPTINLTTLSGDSNGDDVGFTNNSENVYHVVTGATGATLDGFTITAGNANGIYANHSDSGGGMLNYTSNPTVTNTTFSGNSADFGGGMENFSSSPRLTNVTFSSNLATSTGGGVSNENLSSPILVNVTFIGNVAIFSGGMSNSESGNNPIILTNVTSLVIRQVKAAEWATTLAIRRSAIRFSGEIRPAKVGRRFLTSWRAHLY
ncbi:MAG: hypothetical protein IPL71_11210 [Anaerolineales bacterium]|uniref:hypothetical protein n=1 Tax=Candidatus Villigracilis proximus TaxID=3140683 RepID=UPI003134F912|nr:hypothetical protein [Anaerolineales bacterium]